MLLQILNYLKRENVVSNQQLARQFGLELSALQPMLDCWLKKGMIRVCPKQRGCQSRCSNCKNQPTEYYQYCGH